MRRLGGAAAAAAVLLALTACGSQAPPPDATPTVTVVRTPSATPSVAPTSSAAPSATATGSSAPTTAAAADDPNRPADQCPDDAIGISLARSGDGGGAGSDYLHIVFTNTGGDSCVLRGAPGVSVVGGGDGAQIGPAASRDQSGAQTVRLQVGGSADSLLKLTDIGTSGGPLSGCTVRSGDGYRIYPPHSTRAFLVRDSTAKACADGPVSMSVDAVERAS